MIRDILNDLINRLFTGTSLNQLKKIIFILNDLTITISLCYIQI